MYRELEWIEKEATVAYFMPLSWNHLEWLKAIMKNMIHDSRCSCRDQNWVSWEYEPDTLMCFNFLNWLFNDAISIETI
jgi:hypothetical protein